MSFQFSDEEADHAPSYVVKRVRTDGRISLAVRPGTTIEILYREIPPKGQTLFDEYFKRQFDNTGENQPQEPEE